MALVQRSGTLSFWKVVSVRIPTNLLAASVASLIVYGGWQLIQSDIESQRIEAATRKERIRFSAELRVRSALAGARNAPSGWVHVVEPEWFRAIPHNHLLPESHAWLEIATLKRLGFDTQPTGRCLAPEMLPGGTTPQLVICAPGYPQ